MKKVLFVSFLFLLTIASCKCGIAQSATGSISGSVMDSSGAAIPNASVVIVNSATSVARNLTTNDSGLYSAPGLEAGNYDIRVSLTGFKTTQQPAEVQAGNGTTVNVTLAIGETTEVVNVSAATPEMNYETHSVTGVVEHQSIESLPLNGRSFMQTASLLPGVQVVSGAQSVRNSPISISILGGGGQYALLTMDGLMINDFSDGAFGAGTAINFSQEVVQEFQLSSANFDLSTGSTIQGAVNMVTRSGGNKFHGSVYYFYRDHNMAAYPAYKRNTFNPNPYFVRKNPGVTLSGPIKQDKLFYFFSYEDTDQVSAVTVQPDLPSIAGLSSVFTAPNVYHYTTLRLDYQPTPKNSAFFRWTNDDNNGFGPVSSATFPSNWLGLYNWSDQFALGLTTTVSPTKVNEFRFAFRDWLNKESYPTSGQCGNPCLGGTVANLAPNGLPSLSMVGSSVFATGNNGSSPQNRDARDYEWQDNFSWQKGSHRIKFGGDEDYYNQQFNYPECQTGCIGVYSVENTRSAYGNTPAGMALQAKYSPNLPTTITTSSDLLNLPLSYPSASQTTGFEAGPGLLPGPYLFAEERRDWRSRMFFQDFWKLRPNLTVNYGAMYAYESGLLPTHVPIPGIEGPLFGLAANTTQPPIPSNKFNITPAFGFSYSPGTSGKWVVRGGAGMYFDTNSFSVKVHPLSNMGPVGNGPVPLGSTVFTIPTNGDPQWNNIVFAGPNGTFPQLAPGASIPTTTFTNLTLGQFMQIYNLEYPAINSRFIPSNPTTSGTYQYSNEDLLKQAGTNLPPHFPLPRSYQTSVGFQRDMGHNLVITVDWVRRQIEHLSLSTVDLNHFSEYINQVQTPAIPKCTSSQLFVLGQECSTGGFATYLDEGRAVYEGLLVRANKKLSHRTQFNISYAYQNLNSEQVVNLNNYRQGYGPTLAHHNLNAAGIVQMPLGIDLSVNTSFITRTPVEITTTSVDLSGTGAVSSGPLPGLPFRGLPSKSAVSAAVTAYNNTYAGTHGPNGATIPTVVLPANYELGRPTISQDFRLTKVFHYHERYSLSLYGEVFNALNIANLSGYSYGLSASSGTNFGQPTARAGQVFLSSGPRAEQVGARINF